MKPNILILGGGGFIGTNLSLHLKTIYNVYIINRINNNLNVFLKANEDIILLSDEIENVSSTTLYNYNFNSIIWLAHNSVPASNNDLISDFNIDIFPMIDFTEKLKSISFKGNFIYFSSGGTVYGNQIRNIPIIESVETNPISRYGYLKSICENTLKFQFVKTEINLIIIRPSNVYGRFQNINKPQGLIGHAINCAVTNTKLKLFDNGSIIRDYIHINDLCNFMHNLLQSNQLTKFEIFNVGSSIPTSISEILFLITDVTKTRIEVHYEEPRPFDCIYNVLNISKSKNIANWQPEIKLKEGIEDYWKWIQKIINEQ